MNHMQINQEVLGFAVVNMIPSMKNNQTAKSAN